jgi:hypothetical protein
MISQEGLVLIIVGLGVVVVLAATMFNLKILSICFKLYTEYFKDRAMSKRTEAGAPADQRARLNKLMEMFNRHDNLGNAPKPKSPPHPPSRPSGSMVVNCWNCGEPFDLVPAGWCKCLIPSPSPEPVAPTGEPVMDDWSRLHTKVCPHCGKCYHKNPNRSKHRVAQAPEDLQKFGIKAIHEDLVKKE